MQSWSPQSWPMRSRCPSIRAGSVSHSRPNSFAFAGITSVGRQDADRWVWRLMVEVPDLTHLGTTKLIWRWLETDVGLKGSHLDALR